MFCSVAKGVSPPAAAQQVEVGAHLRERVTRGINAINPRDRPSLVQTTWPSSRKPNRTLLTYHLSASNSNRMSIQNNCSFVTARERASSYFGRLVQLLKQFLAELPAAQAPAG
jgi:hypothetical protein